MGRCERCSCDGTRPWQQTIQALLQRPQREPPTDFGTPLFATEPADNILLEKEFVVRCLAAILAADMVGYSRLMSEDEMGTRARYRVLHDKITKPLIDRYGGRILALTGDGFLAEFYSVVSAVECTLALQQDWSNSEQKLLQERRLVFRAGINLGDVIFEDDEVYGEGLNLAVRLKGLAELGGICLSEDAYR